MFEKLPSTKNDPILALMGMLRDDPRAGKIDLGVGVYKDANGHTPVFNTIKKAERQLVESQTSKSYLGLLGDLQFVSLASELALGPALAQSATGCQTAGGSGALAVLARMVSLANPAARVHLPAPGWPNHENIMAAAGLEVAYYPYLDAATNQLANAECLEALRRIPAGDVVVLHGCCHNPTGVDFNAGMWAEIAEIAADRGWVPLIDMAYLGFGVSPAADAEGLRKLASQLPEVMLALSFSKNMGLYRDRTGAAIVVSNEPRHLPRVSGVLATVNRETISMPPDHGAAVARMVLEDDALNYEWRTELETMRTRIALTRRMLADALARRNAPARWQEVGRQQGMFSLLGLGDAQVVSLREEHAIYVVPGGRINIAGLEGQDIERLADALVDL